MAILGFISLSVLSALCHYTAAGMQSVRRTQTQLSAATGNNRQENRTLFVAIKAYDEYDMLSAWRRTFGSSPVQGHGEIEFRFFTYNAELANHSADVIYMPEAMEIESHYPRKGETQFTSPTFWRDYRVGMYRWALQNVNFAYWLEIEIDSVPCWETLMEALQQAPKEDFTLGFNRKPGAMRDHYDDNVLIATHSILQGIVGRWQTYRQRLLHDPAASPYGHMQPQGSDRPSFLALKTEPESSDSDYLHNMNPRVPVLVQWLHEEGVVPGYALKTRFNGCEVPDQPVFYGITMKELLEPTNPNCWNPFLHNHFANYFASPQDTWLDYPFASGASDMCSNRFNIHKITDPLAMHNAWGIKMARSSERDQASLPDWSAFWHSAFLEPIHWT
jgi:hypothetical protein